MAEEAPTIALDVSDFNESSEAEGQTAESESSTDEKKEATPVEGDADSDADDSDTEGDEDSDAEADEAEDEAADEAEDTDDQPKKGAEARKQQLSSEIRELNARKKELSGEIARLNAQVYQPQTEQELLDEGKSEFEAYKEANEQRIRMAEYNSYVTDLNASINTESLQIMADFPVFDPGSRDFDSALAKRAGDLYKEAAQLQVDSKTGLTVRANVLPYNIYKALAETATSGTRRGEVKGQRAAEKMLASAETPVSGGEATKPPKEDAFLAGLTRGLKLPK